MPTYGYICDKCDIRHDIFKRMAESSRIEDCPNCGFEMRRTIESVGITGTRDSFGVGKEFVDENTGKIVDNWRTHEKLGYRDVLEHHAHSHTKVKDGIKKKMKHIRRNGTQKMENYTSIGGVMVITMAELFKDIPKDSKDNKALAAMKVLDAKYKVNFHFARKGVEYFFVTKKGK